MPAKVSLKLKQGRMQVSQLAFTEPATPLLGRLEDCGLRVVENSDSMNVSRYHCLFDINPPAIRIRDFGSMNGTFLNGVKIGQRPENLSAEEGRKLSYQEHDLKNGDEIRAGKTILTVSIFVPAACAECAAEIPEEQKDESAVNPGVHVCARCRGQRTAAWVAPSAPKARLCARCGRDVSGEAGVDRPGEYVCAACQADPFAILARLVKDARAGRKGPAALRDYTLVRELGKGGMGAVYLARHNRTGEEVALKVMLPQVAAGERAIEVFLREVENTKALNHPNVIRLKDDGCSDGTFFFTLEYCDGGAVSNLLPRPGSKIAISQAGPIILQALAGLDYAHHAEVPSVKLADGTFGKGVGLVHRDISPQNLFLRGSGSHAVTKVGDYGLAKAFDLAGLSGQTRSGAAAGKPVYMPRQQVVNYRHSQPEVDVWAVAACFYHLITGFVPRDFKKGVDPWQTVLMNNAVPIRNRDASIPRKLAEVIDASLVDKPQIQIKSAAELRRMLEAVL